ncbi:hypothetical protein E4U59_000770 [Claviceps monticola]|nr:hypothetical protein E4U59_000770 [Claviceps monticola]
MPVLLHKYRCTGVKQCQHLDNALKAPHYDANDHPYWEDRQRTAATYRRPNNLEDDAITWIWNRIQNPSSPARSRSPATAVQPRIAGKRAKIAIQDAHDRALDAQIVAGQTKEEVQELRTMVRELQTAVPDPFAAQKAITAAQVAQSALLANLNVVLQSTNAESDHAFRQIIKQQILDVLSTPAALISAVAPADDPAHDPADDALTPQAVYSRYKEARETWYEKKQLVSSARTDEAYRKAHNLPMLSDSIRC